MNGAMFEAIVFLPLLSAVLLLLFGKKLKEKGTTLLSGGFLFVSMALSWLVFFLHRPLGGLAGDAAGKGDAASTAEVASTVADGTTAVTNNASTAADVATTSDSTAAVAEATHDAVHGLLRDGAGLKQKLFPLVDWLSMDKLHFSWNLMFDSLSLMMLLVVTTVSFLVHVYSKGYMHGDKNFSRFVAYLGFFTFAMLMLISSNNVVQLFFGWEGVGLASYLLIGFWHEKATARAAAIKAFLVNRVGDIGFALGIFALYKLTGELNFVDIFKVLPSKTNVVFTILGADINAITLVCFCCCSWGPWGNRPNLGCTRGCQTRWRGQPRCRPLSTPPPW